MGENRENTASQGDWMSEYVQKAMASISSVSSEMLMKAEQVNKELTERVRTLEQEAEAKDLRLEQQQERLRHMEGLQEQMLRLEDECARKLLQKDRELEELRAENELLHRRFDKIHDLVSDASAMIRMASAGFLLLLREKFVERFMKLDIQSRLIVKESIMCATPDDLPDQLLLLNGLDTTKDMSDGGAKLVFGEGSNNQITLT